MQQCLYLCRALLHEPEELLMEEPFGALDALTREKRNVELHRIWCETGTTVMPVTHPSRRRSTSPTASSS